MGAHAGISIVVPGPAFTGAFWAPRAISLLSGPHLLTHAWGHLHRAHAVHTRQAPPVTPGTTIRGSVARVSLSVLLISESRRGGTMADEHQEVHEHQEVAEGDATPMLIGRRCYVSNLPYRTSEHGGQGRGCVPKRSWRAPGLPTRSPTTPRGGRLAGSEGQVQGVRQRRLRQRGSRRGRWAGSLI